MCRGVGGVVVRGRDERDIPHPSPPSAFPENAKGCPSDIRKPVNNNNRMHAPIPVHLIAGSAVRYRHHWILFSTREKERRRGEGQAARRATPLYSTSQGVRTSLRQNPGYLGERYILTANKRVRSPGELERKGLLPKDRARIHFKRPPNCFGESSK